MRKTFVKDIKDRDIVKDVFLVKEKITAMAKNGKPYLTIRLMDKSGEVDSKVWDNVDQISSLFEKNDFLAITAKASVYLGKMQLVISELSRMREEDVVLADFLPETERSIKEMEFELQALLGSITDCHLAALLRSFFEDPAFMSLYRLAPAAKGMHHVYLGGLLEHSLAVAKLVDAVAPLYGDFNRDLLIAGALLHDAGKIREMLYARSFDYSDEGKLIGHITIGIEMISERIATLPAFPVELGMLLKHLVLAHHGQYEYGSPKRPKTIEATVLNYLDDLDSKINGIRTHIRKEGEMQGAWTSYHRLYDRYFFTNNGMQTTAPEHIPQADTETTPAQTAKTRPGPEQQKQSTFQHNPFEKLRS